MKQIITETTATQTFNKTDFCGPSLFSSKILSWIEIFFLHLKPVQFQKHPVKPFRGWSKKVKKPAGMLMHVCGCRTAE